MRKLFAIALNTFREAVRNKILVSIVLFALVMVGVSALFGSVSIGDQVKVIKDFGLFSLSFFGALASILGGLNLLNNELKRKTVYNILSKPVSRWQFVVGKFLGLSLTTSVLVTLMGLSLIAFTTIMEGKIDYLIFQALMFALLECIIISAITVFFSCMVVTTTLTGFFSFGFYLGGRSIKYLQFFITSEETPVLLKKFIMFLDSILPELSMYNIADSVVDGFAPSIEHLTAATSYCIFYSLAAITLACLIFKHRELT